MRIEAYNQVAQLYNATKPQKTQKTEKASASDKLQISNAGHDYQFAKKAVENAPDVREDITSALKSKIDSGSYSVDPDSFAAKLLAKYEEMR